MSFCIEAGAILAGADEEKSAKLKEFANHIGLAFQIQDDILDITSTTEQLGKDCKEAMRQVKSLRTHHFLVWKVQGTT